MKHLSKTLLATFLLAAALSGCSSSDPQSAAPTGGTSPSQSVASPSANDSDDSNAPAPDADPAKDEIKIGIIQYAPHPSLDNCTTGTVESLNAAGYQNITIEIADGKTETTDMMAKTMVSTNFDIIIPIATPAAMSAYSAAKEVGIPVVFSAVADPLAAGLALDLDNPQTGATGTADALPLKSQLEMIRAFLPNAETVGVLYTTSEPNSITHLAELEALAPEYDFAVEAVGITNESEVATGAVALVAKGVDVVTNFTDNNVVNNLPALLNATNDAGIPVFGSEEEQVVNGCLASRTLNYTSLGNTTGEMAVKILEGADIMTLPVEVITNSVPVFNLDVANDLGIIIPDAYSSATPVAP